MKRSLTGEQEEVSRAKRHAVRTTKNYFHQDVLETILDFFDYDDDNVDHLRSVSRHWKNIIETWRETTIDITAIVCILRYVDHDDAESFGLHRYFKGYHVDILSMDYEQQNDVVRIYTLKFKPLKRISKQLHHFQKLVTDPYRNTVFSIDYVAQKRINNELCLKYMATLDTENEEEEEDE